jgi:hypothetical protein
LQSSYVIVAVNILETVVWKKFLWVYVFSDYFPYDNIPDHSNKECAISYLG